MAIALPYNVSFTITSGYFSPNIKRDKKPIRILAPYRLVVVLSLSMIFISFVSFNFYQDPVISRPGTQLFHL